MAEMKFEWDAKKDQENRKKHGIAFQTAQYTFADPKRVIAEDVSHSQNEKRYFCFGMVGGNVLTVRFTVRGSTIRIFGAGTCRKGKKIYENQS